MTSFFKQVATILRKNFLISFRQKEYLRELVSVLILLGLVLLIYNQSPGNTIGVFYMSIAITSYSRALTLAWVTEKQSRQKQLQKIMGVGSGAYLTAWFTYFLLNGVYVSLVFVLPLNWFGLFDKANVPFIQILGLYLMYMLSTFCFTLFLSSFFNDAKIAAQAITFIQLLVSLLYFLMFSDAFTKNSTLVNLASLFPPLAYDFGFFQIGVINTFSPLQYSYQKGITFLGIDTVLYLVLFLYFDQVLPNEYGTSRHPLFLIKWIPKLFRSRTSSSQRLLQLEEGSSRQKDLSSARYHQNKEIFNKPTVQIINITKSFGDLKAVDNLTLTLYEKQIFCLLGHNGAGKSTTINILTGLIKKDEGHIQINGMNYSNNLDEIRQCIGLCLQQDVLYDSMTVEQHLTYYATMKGVPQQRIADEIKHTIQKCALQNEVGKFAKNLSGGNKRKLSLGNALVGGSKIVFLDEPSSGLDPNSRQAIWDILKQVRSQHRTIILTTHHLEEAEHLAQRIAIMAHGKLLILGDSDFIKQKFGVGYHLFVNFNQSNKNLKTQCVQIINKQMPGIKSDDQSAANVLKYILPVSRQNEFAQLFHKIQDLGLQISLKMCSLEDAFVNVGMNAEGSDNADHQLPELPIISAPKDISPVYNFSSQFKAVFLKKMRTTLKSFSTITSIILPVIFILVGTILTITAFSNLDNYQRFFFLSYFMIWSFIFNTSAYCGGIVLERQKKFKYLSNVMGLRKFPYWAANFAFDICMFLIPVLLFFIITACFGEDASFITQKFKWLIGAFITFSLSFIAYSYTFSFVFQNSSTAYRFFPFMNFLFFYLLPSIPSFVIPDSNLTLYVMPLISPFIAFANCFQSPQMIGTTIYFTAASIYVLMGIMLVQFVFFMTLTLLFQTIRFSLKDRYTIDQSDMNNSEIENQDVSKEISRVRNLDHTVPILVDSLYKKYGNGYLAIKNNTFVVEKGEMFGLLGPNGAGKSTTFNILTAAIPKTGGRVKLNGTEINKGIMEIFQNVGICPQFDSLYDNLTTKDHLSYFAGLKGQSGAKLQELVEYYLQVMQLTEYTNVHAGKLSGGNKRKLCVSMAMIGNPELMFFDEPSSGVDPIARRFLWRTLNESLRETKSSIVLTTHSMNEAESLCTRIGILIKGKFVCLGTPSQLKKKYGNGYRITVKVDNLQNLNKLRELVKQNYPQHQEFIDEETNKITYQISPLNFKFFKAFQLFENKFLNEQLIESFEISQASLEQIFLFFSRMQPVEVNQGVRAEPWELCCFQWGQQGCLLKF